MLTLKFTMVYCHGFYTSTGIFLCQREFLNQFPQFSLEDLKKGFDLQIFHRPGNDRQRFIVKTPKGGFDEFCEIVTKSGSIEGCATVSGFVKKNKLVNRPIYVKIIPRK